jgi:hypothetical protein
MEDEIIEVPAPCTNEMVGLLHRAVESLLLELRESFPFARGDAMSACMYMIVEAGLATVSPEQLREDVIKAFDGTVASVIDNRRRMN